MSLIDSCLRRVDVLLPDETRTPSESGFRRQAIGDFAVTPTPRRTRRTRHLLRMWTFDQAKAVLPYLSSIVRSLREHTLDLQAARRRIALLDARPGRPDRQTLIAAEEARQTLIRLEGEFTLALEELAALDIHPLDAGRGQALVPFLHDEQLAWFIFDLFDPELIRSWRYQNDPEETRRKITTAQMG